MARKNKELQPEGVTLTKEKPEPAKKAKSSKARKTEKKAKRTSVNAANYITSKIPYMRCYEEQGMFEIEPHKYSVVVALFSDTLEDLERDTTLLKISASKYACPIKPFDLQQHEAFVSVLPLGSMKVDVPRLFNADRLSKLLPVNIQSLFEREVTLQGLNEINDNFVLIDRRNYPLDYGCTG